MATPYEDSFEEVNPQDSTPQDNTTTPDKDYSEDFEQIEDLQDKQKDLVPATSKTKEDKIKKANEEDPEEKPEDEETESNNPLVDKFSTFFNKYYKSKIEKLIEDFPKHRSLNVDFGLVEQFDPDLADELIENSEFCFEAMQQVVMNFQSTLIGEVKEKEFDPFVRIINIPKDKRILIKNVSSRHLGKFISIEGIVKQFTTVLPKLKIAHWICKKCGTELNLHQDGFEIIKPKMCPECKHRDFFLDEKRSVFLDYQKLEMQELLEELKGGEQTSTINIFVFGDLVNTFTAGARLVVNGVLKLRPPEKEKYAVYRNYVLCSSIEHSKQDYENVEISKEDEEQIKEFANNPEVYEMLIGSVAPHIYGHEDIKEAIILQLFGGVRKILEQKSKIRGNIHILLMGDPGLGKTQVLLYATQIAPKSIYVAGKTTSGAGLCVGKDSLVFVDNKMIKIKDLVEEQLKKGYELDKDKNLIAKSKSIEITKAYNLDTGKIENSKITNYIKIPINDDLIKITNENGIELITTSNTPILVDKNNTRTYVKASKLNVGDNLVCIKKLNIKPNSLDLINLLDLSNSKIKLTKTKVNEIYSIISNKYKDKRTFGLKEGFNENLLYYSLAHRGIPFIKLNALLNKLKIKLNTKDIEYIFNSHGKPIKIPSVNEDFMYLFGLVLGDGDISYSKERGIVRISNSDLNLLNTAIKITKNLFGKDVKIELQKTKVPTIRINSKVIAKLFYNLGYKKPKVNMTICPELTSLNDKSTAGLLRGIFDTDGYVVNRTTHGSNYVGLTSISKDFIYIINLLLKRFGIISHITLKHRAGNTNYINSKLVRSNYDQYELKIYSKENQELFKRYVGFNAKKKQTALIDIIKKNTKKQSKNYADTYLSKIKSISKCKDKFVYDFTVDKHHNFFANGFLVHNTATAVKDEFGEGGWTLKAGALVLASGGFAMVDEFDKMDPEDRSAMHEALEQETVSIAKAGIVTSFKTETTVLAAANPKYGRFDSYKTIPEQIDVPPTLLSRFDLFFVMKDTIDEKRDTETVASILRTHKSGELLQKEKIANLSSKDQGILEKIKDKPKISPDFIKKYISYARTKIFPVLADSASKDLQKFFINLRQKSQAGRVTVTYRQLEGLIRLSEASARVRLSETVTDADVERAINLYKKSMEQVGLDPESGAFDIDIITTGQSHSTTSKMMKVADIIANIVREQKGAPAKLEKVVEESEKEGIDKTKVKELIDKLQKTGDIYEPKVYHYIPTKKEQ